MWSFYIVYLKINISSMITMMFDHDNDDSDAVEKENSKELDQAVLS